MRILVTGSNGQLGNEIRVLSENYPDFDFNYTDVAELDITNAIELKAFLKLNPVQYIINCAAYTKVDLAETESEKAYLVNRIR